ncbi:MAG: hypothetical protein HZB61_00645 [Nitrospirae bacterium]|nr:hypothetical protein [Nitrospirota bacterium]
MHSFLDFYQQHIFLLIAIAVYIPLWIFLNFLRQRKNLTFDPDAVTAMQPLPLRFGLLDYTKAFISWVLLFYRLFAVRPGLYYTGERDENAPLLVTCNNFLTVFLLARRIGRRNVRLLVIDTNGVNVWCSAAKGSFSAAEIIDKARHFGLIHEEHLTNIILPKLSLSGVKLSDLNKAGIRALIGPLYARELPGYLDKGKFKNRIRDKVHFGFQSRGFTALPTAFQFFYWFLGVYVVTFWMLTNSIIWAATGLAFLYPVFFPFLPGRQFAVKGISLGLAASILTAGYLSIEGFDIKSLLFWVLFNFATSIFIALSFTGNSPVSNYESVRKETAYFLPVVAALYLFAIPVKLFFMMR